MRTLVEYVIQLGMLGLGVSLLLVCINYVSPGHGQELHEEADCSEGEVLPASAARSRIGP